jgi:SAM-dependent methyltransferase
VVISRGQLGQLDACTVLSSAATATRQGQDAVVNVSRRDPGTGWAASAGPRGDAVGSPGGPSSPGVSRFGPDHRYLLDNARAEAGERFVALAELFDGVTRGHFDRLGVGPGWRCWEVGAGGRSIPEALAAAVGPGGYVLATDINPGWLDPHGTYDVRQHDLAADPPPALGAFDLVHARLVLVHVPDRARALATMVAALRPGGWLLVEDADTELQPLVCLEENGPAQQRANRLRRAFRELMTHRGADLRYGRTLPRTLREAGLVDVAAVGSSRSAGRYAIVWRSRPYDMSAPNWSPPG